jgi:glycosyltransferase involved in cell wall biosynthesis
LQGTPYSDFGSSAEDRAVVEMVRKLDRRTLMEARRLFTISGNTAARLKRYLELEAEPLYPPPPLRDALAPAESGDYVLSVGRLDRMKRSHLFLEALARTKTPLRGVVVGQGPEMSALRGLAARLGVEDRIEFTGRLGNDELVRRYAGALGVFYAPFDEDYGYVTLEAFHAGKPVVTTADSGGVLEFVEHGETGWIAGRSEAAMIAPLLDRLWNDRARAAELGKAGRNRALKIDWDRVITALTATL